MDEYVLTWSLSVDRGVAHKHEWCDTTTTGSSDLQRICIHCGQPNTERQVVELRLHTDPPPPRQTPPTCGPAAQVATPATAPPPTNKPALPSSRPTNQATPAAYAVYPCTHPPTYSMPTTYPVPTPTVA